MFYTHKRIVDLDNEKSIQTSKNRKLVLAKKLYKGIPVFCFQYWFHPAECKDDTIWYPLKDSFMFDIDTWNEKFQPWIDENICYRG